MPLSTDGGKQYPDVAAFTKMVNDYIKDNIGVFPTKTRSENKEEMMLTKLFPNMELRDKGIFLQKLLCKCEIFK